MLNARLSRRSRGFTLVEICISLIIIGVTIVPLIWLYDDYRRREAVTITEQNLQGAVNAIHNFVQRHGRYPCPAPLRGVSRGDPEFGHEHATACLGASASGLAPGECAGGVCVETSARTLGNPRVVVGMLPFRVLQVEENRASDAYGSRLVYAVTESMTQASTFNPNAGAISVVDSQGQPLSSPPGSTVYLVLSHGPTAAGGYDAYGTLKSPCEPGTPEAENCNVGFETGGSSTPQATYVAASRNDVAGAQFYDDSLEFFSTVLPPTWSRTTADRDNIVDLSSRFVGIGTDAPAFSLDISSRTLAIDSLALYADELCNEAGADCFRTSVLTGPADGVADNDEALECPAGEYLLRIEQGRAVCAPAIDLACPSGQIMLGLNGDGTLRCAPVPLRPCLAADAPRTSICGTPISVPDLAHSQSTLVVLRDRFQDHTNMTLNSQGKPIAASSNPVFNCKSFYLECLDGTWEVKGEKGACGWSDPPPEPLDPAACGVGFTGTVARSEQLHCDGSKSILTAPAGSSGNECVCNAGRNVTSSPACNTLPGWASDATGNAEVYYNVSCPDGALTGPFTDTSGCGCTATNTAGETRWVETGASCPTGWLAVTGEDSPPAGVASHSHPLEKQQRYSNTCTWADTTNRRGSCVCDLSPRRIERDPSCAENSCNKKVTNWVRMAQVDPATCSLEPEERWVDLPGFEDTTERCAPAQFHLNWTGLSMGSNNTGSRQTQGYVGAPCDCTRAVSGATTMCHRTEDNYSELLICDCK